MDDEDEDYVLYGTSLPEIEDEATLRRKAGKELQVRDEKGRQRFHGAFTGGFSAGFFNTVGTKEGWAPSTFVSSRSKVADRVQQNPEDFMDDEDLGEFGIATRKIHTTSNFESTSTLDTHKRKYVDSDNIIPGEAPLKDIIHPVRESIGMLILKKLGWRLGQGIGPRIKKYTAGSKKYGCSPFPDSEISEVNDPVAMAFTFAPEDMESMSYKSKDNLFGLGYTGLSKQSVLGDTVDPFAPTTTKSWLAKDKRKLKISGQAFGVGAFEDEDEDIYAKDDMSRYDFSDLAIKESQASNKAIGHPKYGKFQEVLTGFCLASQPKVVKKHYPLPELPANFKPMHLKSVASSQSVNPTISSSRHALSASDRSLLLGERKFQTASLNASTSCLEPAHNFPSSSTASANFKVFPNDSGKQQRYEEYLKLKEKGDLKKLIQWPCMTEWEKQQEIEEFAKVSASHLPLSNPLQARFESRSHLGFKEEVVAALEKIKKEKEEKPIVTQKDLVGTTNRKIFDWHPVPFLCKRMNVPNPYPNSESKGTQAIFKSKSVFDHLSFKTEEPSTSKKIDCSILKSSANFENKTEISPENMSDNVQTEIPDVSNSFGNNKNAPPAIQKPPIDFFKDIFEDSSSDNEDEDEEDKPQDDQTNPKEGTSSKNDNNHIETEVNLHNSSGTSTVTKDSDIKVSVNQNSTNKKVGFGVFANLDLDALNQKKTVEKPMSTIAKAKNDTEDVIDLPVSKDDDQNQVKNNYVYGPELPPNFSDVPVTTNTHTSSPFKASPKKRSKSKSSRKHKHHKSKHKKKKKSSKRNSSDSSDVELEDIPPSLIIEKLKKLQRKM